MTAENESATVAQWLAEAYNARMREQGTASVAGEAFAETMTGGRIFTVMLDGRTYVVNVFSAENQDDKGPLFSYA